MALQKTPLSPSPAHVPTPSTVAAPQPTVKPVVAKKPVTAQKGGRTSLPFWIGLGVSIAWVLAVMVIGANAETLFGLNGVAISDVALGVCAAVSPVAMVWMITAYLQRATDIESITDPLRRQLTLITGESGAADARIRRFNQAIREQIDLLRGAQSLSLEDMEAIMDRVQQHRAELERFENVSTQQIKEIQDVVRRSMFQVEQMMDDKFTMLRVLDGKLQQNGEGLVGRVEGVGERVSRILSGVEQSCELIADALDRAQRDSQKLADTSRLQEASLTNAAETAAEMLGGLSSKIDLNVARFLERASSARDEAERMAQALDAQTRALDDFSATMPVRVSDAESIMRGVADRLHASEQMACEQASNLSSKLSEQIDGLRGVMDQFSGRFSDVDAGLDRRRVDLNAVADKIGSTASGFFGSWEKSIDDLNDRMGNTLLRFTVVNDETRRNSEAVTGHLNETVAKYEDVVTRMRAMSSESGEQMKQMTGEMSAHLAEFEKITTASNKAGEEVQAQAGAALQNLQQVLERVLSARDATQAIGQLLVKDIGDAVGQNEKMIQRLSEAAQLSARSIGSAAENLGRQEGELLGKARASEAMLKESIQKLQEQAETAGKGLRDQTSNLMALLAEAQGQLMSTDKKLQSFATQAVAPVQKAMEQMDASADQGLRTLGAYNEGMALQVERLRDFHARIGSMSQEVSKTTATSAGAFEALSERFSKARAAQEEDARRTLALFTELSERLQREVSGLDGHAAQSIELLKQAAVLVSSESTQMSEKAKASETQIKGVVEALQTETAQVQDLLRKQTETIGEDLALAERRFTALGEIIREKADVTHAALDRTAAHYSDVSQKLDQTVDLAQGKVENLQMTLARQVDQIGADAARIEMQTSDIVTSSGRAIDTLSSLKDSMGDTHDKVVAHTQDTLSKLDETSSVFQARTTAMANAAKTAAESVVKTSAVFDEQAGKLVSGSLQIADVLSRLSMATDALTERAKAVRSGMETQNEELLAKLTASVSQLDATSASLNQVAASATAGADQVSVRYTQLSDMAHGAETALAALGANVTQQAATLSIVGEQLEEQQKMLSSAHERQRAQMLAMFDKLNDAHATASEVAERTISSLAASLSNIDSQIEDVSGRSMTALGNVKTASVGFSDQSALLLQNAQAAEQQARTVLQVTSALQEQAAQLRASLQSESDRASESLSGLLGRLTSGSDQIRVIGTDTTAVLSAIDRAMADRAGDLNGAMERITERQRVLTSALDAQRENIDLLLSRLTAAQDQTASVSEQAVTRLADGAQKIAQSAEFIDTRAQDALTSMQRAVAGFGYEAEAIEKKAKQVANDTREILATASELRNTVDGLRTSMHDEGETTRTVLATLLDQVKTGTGDLREVSEAAERSLISLNENVLKQGVTLTASVKDMGEKQTVLVSALDGQRETISNLLSRFGQAQDEAVVVAARTAARLNEEAQSITASIDMIGAHASTTLASVQASVGGFAEQAVAMKMQGDQAEFQVRSLMSTTSEMNERSKQMRESVQAETDRIVSLLGDVIGKLDVASHHLKDESGAAALAFDQTEQRFATLTQAGADIVQTQTQALNQAISQSEMRMDQVNEKARGQIKLVNEFGDKAEAQAQQLANAAEFATTRLVALRDTISSTEKSGADVLSSTADRIDEVKKALEAKLEQLTEFSKVSADQVIVATQKLVTESDVLRINLASSESALTEAANLVREEAKHLPVVIDRSTANIQAATKLLKEQTTDADQVLVGTADRFISVTASVRNNMAEEIKRVGVVAEDASKILTGFNQLLAEQVSSIRQGTSVLSSEQQELIEKASQGVETLSEASERLVALRNEAASMADRLVREFAVLDQRAAETGGRLVRTGEEVAKQVGAIGVATEAITQQSDALRSNLATSEAALKNASESVRDESHKLFATMNESISNIEATSKNLKAHVVEADQMLGGTADLFATTMAKANASINQEMTHVNSVASDAGKILTGFNQLLGEQVSAMQQSTAILSSEQRDLIEKANLGVDTLSIAGQRLASLRSEASATAEKLAHEFSVLDQRATATGGRLAQAGEGIAHQAEAIAEAAANAESRVTSVSGTFRDQLERIKGGLQGQIDEISRGLLQITAQLERTGGNLRSTAVGAVADVERVGQRFEQTGAAATAQVSAETEKMRKATEEVASMLSGFGSKFDQVIDHMVQAGTDMKSQEGASVEHLQRMLGHLGVVAEKLETARKMSTDVSKQTVEKLEEVVSSIETQMTKMTSGAQTAAGIMRGIGQIYNDQTASLSRGMGDAHSQILGMNKSIDDMQERTDRMRAALKLQGEDLMGSMRLILAQLEMTGDGLTDAVNSALRQQLAAGGGKKIN